MLFAVSLKTGWAVVGSPFIVTEWGTSCITVGLPPVAKTVKIVPRDGGAIGSFAPAAGTPNCADESLYDLINLGF